MEFSVQHVRELKGAPLAVLLLLSLSTVPVTQEWLERMSGYTDRPVSQALAYLRETGRATRTMQGWSLAAGVQLALLAGEVVLDGRNISDSINIISIDGEESLKPLTTNNINTTRKNSDSFLDAYSDDQRLVWSYLSEMGVMWNSRVQKLLESNPPPDYVKEKCLELRARGLGKGYAGLLIRNIEDAVS